MQMNEKTIRLSMISNSSTMNKIQKIVKYVVNTFGLIPGTRAGWLLVNRLSVVVIAPSSGWGNARSNKVHTAACRWLHASHRQLTVTEC